MIDPTTFKDRLDEAVRALSLSSRAAFAERLGVGENSKQVVHQWITRGWIPAKYGPALAREGLSWEYLSEGKGTLTLAPASQSAGPDLDMIRDAVKVARLVRDNSLEPVSDDVFVEVLSLAIQRVSGHSGALDLPEMAREVAAAFRSRGQSNGDKR
jgi:hypothetical protein